MRPTFRFSGAKVIPEMVDLGTRDSSPEGYDVDNSPSIFKPNDLKLNKQSLHREKTGLEIGHKDIIINQPVAPTTMTSEVIDDDTVMADLEPGSSTLDPMINEYPEPLKDWKFLYDPNVTNELHNIVSSPIGRLRLHATLIDTPQRNVSEHIHLL